MILKSLLPQYPELITITIEVITWQNRPLEDLYLKVWIDGIVFKVREGSKVINKTIY